MQDVMKTPILENDGVMKEEEETANIGIFTVDPEHPVYQDPFYENDSTVLASFPFDQKNFGETNNVSLALVIFSLAFILFYVFSAEFSFHIFIWIVILCQHLPCVWMYITTRRYRRRAHIAIATTGIYLDESIAPGSRILKNRQVFKYEDYQQCYLQKHCNLECDVMLKKKNSIEPPTGMVLVKGLLGTQTFVDQVNAMIERMAPETRGGDAFVVAERLELGSTVALDQSRERNWVAKKDAVLGNLEYHRSQDSFYENDSTVIASFSLDQHIFDQQIMQSGILMVVLMVLFVIFNILAFLVEDLMVLFPVSMILILVSVPFLLFYRLYIHQLQLVRSCTHIAIAETGVYVDTVSHPRSRIHMSRTVFLYEDYDSCHLEEGANSGFFGYAEHRIMLKKKNHSDPPVILAWGILEPHLFAEKVQAMIEQTADRAASTMPIASQV